MSSLTPMLLPVILALAASATDERTIPCYSCGERLPVDPVIVQRHVNERHPEVVGPGVNRNARSLAASATDEGEPRCVHGFTCDHDERGNPLAASATDEPKPPTDYSVWDRYRKGAASATDEEWTAEDERRARLREQRRAASATDEPT